MYSPFCNSTLSPSYTILGAAFFTLTFPFNLDDTVVVFVSNSLGSGFSSISFSSSEYLKRLARNFWHFGQSWSFGYGFTILYPQCSHSTASSFLPKRKEIYINSPCNTSYLKYSYISILITIKFFLTKKNCYEMEFIGTYLQDLWKQTTFYCSQLLYR